MEEVVWFGMVWYGMVWYGMVWYGMVWYGDRPGRGLHQAQLQGLQVTQAALVMLRSVQFATFKEYFEST